MSTTVRFHKPGTYAHSDLRKKHLHVPKHQLEHEVDDDMLARCEEFGWARPVEDGAVEVESETKDEKIEVETKAADGPGPEPKAEKSGIREKLEKLVGKKDEAEDEAKDEAEDEAKDEDSSALE